MDRTGQSRGVLRIVSVSLSFLLAFGMMAALPTAAYADEEYVCMIGDVKYKSFHEALWEVSDGGTIKLLCDTEISSSKEVDEAFPGSDSPGFQVGIYLYGQTLIIDTNGFVLDVGRVRAFDGYGNFSNSYSYADYGIWVAGDGELIIVDSSDSRIGQVNATGYRPVRVDGAGSKVTISNAIGIAGFGADVRNGGSLNITGDITGSTFVAAKAENGSSITVMGNVSANAATALLATGSGSSIEVRGDVTSVSSAGSSGSVINATEDASIKVHGNVSSDASSGVLAEGANTTVEIKGNLSAAQGTGVQAVGGATVSIDGTLTASDYIKLGTSSDDTTSYPKESGRYSQRKPNYYEYTDNTNYVYVRSDGSIIDNSVGVPGSGDLYGRGYASMDVALAVARIVVGEEVNLTPAQFAAIDMDFDGVLTMTDVLLIMRKAFGL